MSQQSSEPYNPFGEREKVPAVSWAGAPVGASIEGRVVEHPREVQARDFKTGELEVWTGGDPKMNVVTRLDINGEVRDLWCVRPSALYGAIVEALKQTPPGYLDVGGTLRITYVGDKPNDDPRLNAAKQFTVQYRAPNAFSNGAQPWQQQAQQQQPAQTWQQQQPAQQQADPWASQQQSDEPPF